MYELFTGKTSQNKNNTSLSLGIFLIILHSDTRIVGRGY